MRTINIENPDNIIKCDYCHDILAYNEKDIDICFEKFNRPVCVLIKYITCPTCGSRIAIDLEDPNMNDLFWTI